MKIKGPTLELALASALKQANIEVLSSDPGTPVQGQIYFNSSTGKFRGYDGATWADLGAGAGLTWIDKNANYTAVAGDGILADTSTIGAFQVTLPASPNDGDTIGIMDVLGTFETANLTLGRNGNLIMGLAEDFVCNVNNAAFSVVYTGADKGWKLFNYLQQGSTETPPGGSDGNVQFNDNGSFGGSSDLNWDGSVLSLNGVMEYLSNLVAAAAPSGKGRIRYNDDLKQFEASMDGSEWMPFGPAASSSSSSSGVGTISDARKYSEIVGNGVDTTFVIQHNMNVDDVVVQVWRTGATRELVTVDVEIIDSNVVEITFASAPSAGAFQAVVVG